MTNSSNDSSRMYAKAPVDVSYQIYNNVTWSWWSAHMPLSRAIVTMWEESTNNRAYNFRCFLPDKTLLLYFSNNGSTLARFDVPGVFDGSWKHIIVSFSNGVVTVYINGVAATVIIVTAWAGGAAGFHPANQSLMLCSQNPAAPPIDTSPAGCITNLSIWNKVLNSDERTELYNQGRPGNLALHSAYANCTNWWPVDQNDTTTTLRDQKNGVATDMTITYSGASGRFIPSANHPTASLDPGVAAVLSGQPYIIDGEAKTGTMPAPPTASEIATAVLDTNVVETGYSVRNSLRLMLAALAGKVSGAPTTAVTIRNANDTKNRIVATVDANGNRSAVTHDVTD